MADADLTASRLREILHYDPETGLFTWKQALSRRTAVGSRAGHADKSGYVRIRLAKGKYPAHRLAVLYVTGEWPADEVDHINGQRADNRYANLRQCTKSQNNCNRPSLRPTKTGVKGVRLTDENTYEVRIGVEKRQIHVGTFKDIGEATQAYADAAARYHGEFAHLS